MIVLCHWLKDDRGRLHKIMAIDGVPVKRIVSEDYDGRVREYKLFDDEVEYYSKQIQNPTYRI